MQPWPISCISETSFLTTRPIRLRPFAFHRRCGGEPHQSSFQFSVVYLFAPNHIKTVYALFGIIKGGSHLRLVDPALKHFELEEWWRTRRLAHSSGPDRQTDVFIFYKEIRVKHYQLSREDQGAGRRGDAVTAADDGFAKRRDADAWESFGERRSDNWEYFFDARNSFLRTNIISSFIRITSGVIAPCFVEGDFIITETSSLEKTRNIARLFETRSITHFHAVPFVYYLLARNKKRHPEFSSVKLMICGGNKLSARVANNLRRTRASIFGKDMVSRRLRSQ